MMKTDAWNRSFERWSRKLLIVVEVFDVERMKIVWGIQREDASDVMKGRRWKEIIITGTERNNRN